MRMIKGKKFSEKAFKKGKGPNANSPHENKTFKTGCAVKIPIE